ncbi:MAG: AAA family ATPase [Treponemataceae bacterium]|nr:AAA family ATPase [Treponemataceae bacterium]
MAESIEEIEKRIQALPRGTIVTKNIDGKPYFYQQYKENKKTVSNFLSNDEAEKMRHLIEERRELQKKLREMKKNLPSVEMLDDSASFIMNAITGAGLLEMAETAKGFKKRDCYDKIASYLYGKPADKVCLVYGLRRTGKTTLLKQLILDMKDEDRNQTIYIKARAGETIADLNKDIKTAREKGIKFLLIDEITLLEDFIDNAALLSDVYAVQGLKFVLSGTDSLGFYFAESEELYDRAVTVHTTFIPYKEHARLLGITSIDEYIRYGGTLKAGELDFDNEELNVEEASFRDDESARRYIDTAICKNIQHSLRCYQKGRYFRHLRELYDANELTNAINRIIEDENHDFTVKVITDLFESHDLGSAAQLLRKARDEDKRTDILDEIDESQILSTLKKILEIKEKDNQKIGVTETHVTEIKQYLKRLDLIDDLDIETLTGSERRLTYTIFTQPGMRFCQAQALVYSLMKDEQIRNLQEREINLITEKIIEGVLGHMLEDIVIYETKRVLMPKRHENKKQVFQIRFEAGEFDMLIYDNQSNTCEIYEIKHSLEAVPYQYRHLINEDKTALTENRFGRITRKCVLYRGETMESESDVQYKNVEEYLNELGETK